MYKINLKEIEIKDLNGLVIPVVELPKDVGNLIFINAMSIEVSDIARALHKGDPAQVTELQLQEIITVVRKKPPYAAFATLQILEYLQGCLDSPMNVSK